MARWTALLLPLAGTMATRAEPPADLPARAAIARLGDESSQVREAATEDLVHIGADIDLLLEDAAARATDPEVLRRLRLILKRRHLELPAAAPAPVEDPDITRWKAQLPVAREAEFTAQPHTVEGSLRVLQFAAAEPDEKLRRRFSSHLDGVARACARLALLRGEDALALRFLDLALPGEDGLLARADLLRATGTLEPELAKLTDPAARIDPAWRLALLRAADRAPEALRTAPPDSEIHARLALLTGDPVPLVRRLISLPRRENAAWHATATDLLARRWEGGTATPEDLRVLRGLPQESAKLFSLGDVDVAETRLCENSRLSAFRYFVALERLDEAFRVLGLDPAAPDFPAWIAARATAAIEMPRASDEMAPLRLTLPPDPAELDELNLEPSRIQDITSRLRAQRESAVHELAAVLDLLVRRGADQPLATSFQPLLQLGNAAPHRLRALLDLLRGDGSLPTAAFARQLAHAWAGDDLQRWNQLGYWQIPPTRPPGETAATRSLQWQQDLARIGTLPPQAQPAALDDLLGRAVEDSAPHPALEASRRRLALLLASQPPVPCGPPRPLELIVPLLTGRRPAVPLDGPGMRRELFFRGTQRIVEHLIFSQEFPRGAPFPHPDPTQVVTDEMIGHALQATAAGDWDLATGWWTLLAARQPAIATHRAFLADALRHTGHPAAATAADQHVALLVLGDPIACRHLAAVCEWTGDLPRAEAWRRRAALYTCADHASTAPLARDATRHGDWALAAACHEADSALLLVSAAPARALLQLRARTAADACRALARLPGHRDASLATLRACHARLAADCDFTTWFFPALRRAGLQDLHDELHERSWQLLAASHARFPGTPETWNTAAALAAAGQRHLPEALALTDRALQASPEDSTALRLRADLEAASGHPAAAQDLATRARAATPLRAIVLRNYDILRQ